MNMRRWIMAGMLLSALAAAAAGFWVMKQGTQTRSDMQGHVHGSLPAVEQTPEAAGEEPLTVEIPEDARKLIGARTVPAEVSDMTTTVRLAGRIDYDEKLLFTVNTKVEGWIERLYVDYTGRLVKKGEPLIEIYSPDLLAAQEELISLSAWKRPEGASSSDSMLDADSQRLKAAARQRLRLWDISDAQIERILKAGKPERTLTIVSSASGYVTKRYATQGMRVMAGEPLFDIVDLSRVWVVSQVSEPDMALVKKGQKVRISVAGLGGTVLDASIDYVYPVINEQTRTLEVRSTLANPKEVFKPQMFATVEITVALGKRLSVPDDAVMDTGERRIVYVDRGNDLFEPRQVTAGISAGGRREIVSGLKAGEKVASSALFLIDSEAQLKGVVPTEK